MIFAKRTLVLVFRNSLYYKELRNMNFFDKLEEFLKKDFSDSLNRSVYASGAVAPSGYEKPQSACGLCAVFLRHILARRIALWAGQNVIQPERYATYD
jgi:hypothetical protein